MAKKKGKTLQTYYDKATIRNSTLRQRVALIKTNFYRGMTLKDVSAMQHGLVPDRRGMNMSSIAFDNEREDRRCKSL